MTGERNLTKAGYRFHVFAYFRCNSGGVRVAIRKTARGAARFARSFSRKNGGIDVTWSVR